MDPCSCSLDGCTASDPISLLSLMSAVAETLGSESIAGCFSTSELAGRAVANSRPNEPYIRNSKKSMSLGITKCLALAILRIASAGWRTCGESRDEGWVSRTDRIGSARLGRLQAVETEAVAGVAQQPDADADREKHPDPGAAGRATYTSGKRSRDCSRSSDNPFLSQTM